MVLCENERTDTQCCVLFFVDIQYIGLISCTTILRNRITPLPKPMQSASLGKILCRSMSFQHIWPRGPSMLESIKENALFGNIVALVRKHRD